MPSEQSATTKTPSIAVGKITPSHRARQDSVSLLETHDYVCLQPDTSLSQAIEIMKQDEGGCAIVCAPDESVVGIFTARDLLTKIVGQTVDLSEPVSKWMSPDVATLGPEATIGEAVSVMNEKGYRNIPLVNNGKLQGSISVFDVIRYLAESYPQSTINLPPNPDQIMDSVDGG